MSDCWDCGLPDPYNGDGDGIGSCRCPRAACGHSPTDVDLGACRCGDEDWWDDDGQDGLDLLDPLPSRRVTDINTAGERL